MHPQLSSARLYIAQQRSAAQRSAVQCLAFRFAVLCRAALCVLLNMRQQLLVVYSIVYSCSTRYSTDTSFMYVFCTRLFDFFR